MPVVINDFEVVADAPAVTPRSQECECEEKKIEAPTAAEELLHWLHERQERVRAH